MLAESSDLTPVGWIKQARDKKLEVGLNKAGSLSFSLPITDDMALDILGQDIVRCVIAYCDDKNGNPVARWSGPIWTTTASVPTEKISVNCVGWYEILNHRELKFDTKFVDIDAGQITSQIISDANHSSYLVNLISNNSFESGSAGWTDSGFDSIASKNDWSTSSANSLTLETASVDTLDTDYLDVTANETYSVYLDFKSDDIDPPSSLRVDILWYTSLPFFISTSTVSFSGDLFDTKDTEQYISGTVTAPATAAFAIYRIRVGGGIVNVDNAIFVVGENNGVTTTPISIGDITESQTREIKFQAGTKHGSAIDTLVNMEAGFDWYIDPLTREMDILYDNVKGTIYGRGVDNTDVEFGYGWGPRNVSAFDLSTDSSILANRMSIKGKYHTGVAYDEDSINAYGLYEDSVSLSDVVDEDILVAYAGAETAYRLQPFKTYNFTPFPYDGSDRIPLLFEDYDIGDIVYLTVKYGPLNIERQAVRVFGVSIDIDNEGNEKLGQIQSLAS